MTFEEADISLILKAVKFSAEKHKTQRRKGAEGSPYINHPIDVAETLWRIGRVRDVSVIAAAVLHDTVEDTNTKPCEIDRQFGSEIRSLVDEVSDDKSLPKAERKRLQIEHAPQLSKRAQQIKLADKIFNVAEMTFAPPDWSLRRRAEYLDWSERVVSGLRGCNPNLEDVFDLVMRVAKQGLGEAVSTSAADSDAARGLLAAGKKGGRLKRKGRIGRRRVSTTLRHRPIGI